MAMDLRNPDTWISHLLENLPEDKLACALKDDNPDWEYIDGEMLKLGSLAHSQLDIPEIQRRGVTLLASESKDFRLLAHLLRTLQHAGDPLLALRLLALYVEHYWTVAAPGMAHKKRFAAQVIKRFEAGIPFLQKMPPRCSAMPCWGIWQNWRYCGRAATPQNWRRQRTMLLRCTSGRFATANLPRRPFLHKLPSRLYRFLPRRSRLPLRRLR